MRCSLSRIGTRCRAESIIRSAAATAAAATAASLMNQVAATAMPTITTMTIKTTGNEMWKLATPAVVAPLSPSPLLRPTRVLLARRMQGRRRTRQREATPGDWLCQCGEVNYRSKRECFKCGAPAPPLPPGVRRPSLPGEDPHDWACPCGQMNFRGSVVCYKCAQPKPEPPPAPGAEVTLWTCPGCKGINRSNRRLCFKCGAPSPLLEFKPVQ